MQLSRRQALAGGGTALLWTLSGCAGGLRPGIWREQRERFVEGVASGDPAAESVILWTRYSPNDPTALSATLTVEVARDADFADIVAKRKVTVDPALDWTCRILVDRLQPAREYWYRFTDNDGAGSRVGRTLTAPADDDPRAVRFAFVSCQDLNQSYLQAYRKMVWEDRRAASDQRLGFVLHLGDFIYEILWYPEEQAENYGRRIREVTHLDSHETYRKFHIPVDLADYRKIYHAYLRDPDLQDVRAWLPFVTIWDNHEFSWQGYQSIQVFGGNEKPAQTRKVAANQAWFEMNPARVRTAAGFQLDRFPDPKVADVPVENFDEAGLGQESNNLAAINSLIAYRALRYGANCDFFITDMHSYRCRDRGNQKEAQPFSLEGFADLYPEQILRTIDAGRAANGGHAPDNLSFGPVNVSNFTKELGPQSVLGERQKRWFKSALAKSGARWKIWACSNGVIDLRADPQNLPADFPLKWPDQQYACFGSGDFSSAYTERREILDFALDRGIGPLAIVSGDRHSFWAATVAPDLPPGDFKPSAVSFITGSISAPGMVEAVEHVFKPDLAIRPLYLADRTDGAGPDATINMTMKHGVRSALDYARHGDRERARKLSNADNAPHLSFVDMGGHGYAVTTVTSDHLSTEFVCIPRPREQTAAEDGGPTRYRIAHHVDYWRAGDTPVLRQEIIEGDPGLSV